MIELAFTAPNHSDVTFHIVSRVESGYPHDFVMAHVNSYANEAAFLAGAAPLWGLPHKVPVVDVSGNLGGHIEAYLTRADGPFAGGVIAPDNSQTLAAARDRAWAAIKTAREQAENGVFLFDGGSYQADKVRITGAVQLATLAKAAGAPYSETWTLTDNTTRTLNADQVIGLGIALGRHVSSVYATGRALREQINTAATIDEVAAVRWTE
jgi:hypothetical protein